MHRKHHGKFAILASGVLALAGCDPNSGKRYIAKVTHDGMAYLNNLTAPNNSPQSRGWQSLSAEYQGALRPVTNAQASVAGNTIVFKHPWVNSRSDESYIQENAVYFNSDGTADSMGWTKRPWHVNGNNVCAIGGGDDSCFALYTDDAGETFLFSDELDVLSKVTSIQPGDALRLAARRDERIREDQASTDAANAWVLRGVAGALSTPPSATSSEPTGTHVCDNGSVQDVRKNCPQPAQGY